MIMYLWLMVSTLLHSYYVSITQIEYNQYTQSVEISCKIFTDDLEAALEKATGEKMHLGTDRENPDASQYVRQYLKDRLQFELNGKPVQYNFVGKEISADATWCYLEISGVRELKSLKVTSQLLTDVFETQSNIVHITTGKNKKSLLLSKVKASDTVTF
ncbi:peptidase E [Sphingobacteriales bacterium UPWRP_1]|nr:hypothetical protein B6N25_13000 [Sphingobacteriales bacterium TSM_CSS]PSJ75278.1 peptidase E [Sphingobacteriales bacterium UPWRP_1]